MRRIIRYFRSLPAGFLWPAAWFPRRFAGLARVPFLRPWARFNRFSRRFVRLGTCFPCLPVLLFFLPGIPACKTAGPAAEIVIPRVDLRVEIDGEVSSEEWGRAVKVGHFKRPWSEDREERGTEFFAFADAGYFHFAYRVKDGSMLFFPYREETDVARGDRVEIFFAGNRDLKEYYCLEIDPRNHVLDYKASYYRNFDHSWDCPGLFVRGSESESGYTVEGRIPLSAFREMGLIGPGKDRLCFYGGLYRADFRDNPAGEPFEEWISWIDPGVREPDFHIPSSFGKFCLELEKDINFDKNE